MVIHVLMWLLEGYPFFYILIGLISHFLYFQLLRRFPHIELTNLLFILSCGMYLPYDPAFFRNSIIFENEITNYGSDVDDQSRGVVLFL